MRGVAVQRRAWAARTAATGGSLLSKFSRRVSLRCAGVGAGACLRLPVTGLDLDKVPPRPQPGRSGILSERGPEADTFLLLQ